MSFSWNCSRQEAQLIINAPLLYLLLFCMLMTIILANIGGAIGRMIGFEDALTCLFTVVWFWRTSELWLRYRFFFALPHPYLTFVYGKR